MQLWKKEILVRKREETSYGKKRRRKRNQEGEHKITGSGVGACGENKCECMGESRGVSFHLNRVFFRRKRVCERIKFLEMRYAACLPLCVLPGKSTSISNWNLTLSCFVASEYVSVLPRNTILFY